MPPHTRLLSLPPEVLSFIIEFSSADGYRIHSRPSLAALTRTCRILHELTAAVLWRDLPFFPYLIKTLPDNCWTLGETEMLAFTRALDASDFSRFVMYASHVQVVKIAYPTENPDNLPEGERNPFIIPDNWHYLGRRCPTPALLPNLRSITLTMQWINDFLFPLSLFLEPSLRNIRVFLSCRDEGVDEEFGEGDGNDGSVAPEMAELMREGGDYCPLVSKASFDVVRPAMFRDGFAIMLTRWVHLTSLHWISSPLHPDVLSCLASRRALRSLKINVDYPRGVKSALTGLREREPEELFYGLRELHMVCRHPDRGAEFFRLACRSPELTEARLSVRTAELGPFFAALSCHPSRDSVRAIGFGTFDPTDEDAEGGRPPVVVPQEDLVSLFSMRQITHFLLDERTHVALTDDAFMDLIASWPNIEELHLFGAALSTGHRTPVSLSCFLDVARGCPSLRSLRITVDARAVPLSPAIPTPQRALTSLHVGRSAIDHPEEVARFLTGVFPNIHVQYVWKSWDPWSEPDEEGRISAAWKRVTTLIQAGKAHEDTEKS